MNNLAQRTITAVIGLPIIIGAIYFDETTFLLLLLAISILAMLEFYKLSTHSGIIPQKFFGILTAVLIFLPPLLNAFTGITWNPLPLLIIFPYFIFIRELFTKSAQPFTNISLTLLGIIYIPVTLFLFYLVSFYGENKDHYNPQNIMGYFIIIWIYDTGAYFSGRFFGRHKLFERISPNKTWEGVFGGLASGFAVTFLIAHYFTNLNPIQWFILSSIIMVTGTLGDLVKSLFKRSVNVKDSGTILPGHGGFLDRFDALFISAPFVIFYLLVYG